MDGDVFLFKHNKLYFQNILWYIIFIIRKVFEMKERKCTSIGLYARSRAAPHPRPVWPGEHLRSELRWSSACLAIKQHEAQSPFLQSTGTRILAQSPQTGREREAVWGPCFQEDWKWNLCLLYSVLLAWTVPVTPSEYLSSEYYPNHTCT